MKFSAEFPNQTVKKGIFFQKLPQTLFPLDATVGRYTRVCTVQVLKTADTFDVLKRHVQAEYQRPMESDSSIIFWSYT